MNEKQHKSISRFLSLVLRHRPALVGVTLSEGGWVLVEDLLSGMHDAGRHVTQTELFEVVRANDKQRFQLSEDGERIRATQGHSVDVDLGYRPAEPPEVLLHGTPEQFVSSIRREGLKKQKRHHVHLHEDASLAGSVGKRRGRPVVLEIAAREMDRSGFEFFVTPNAVWLTDHVPPQFIRFPNP